MKTRLQVQELVYGSLLAAVAILIPTVFKGWLQVYIPPFSATLGSHVPTMLAMFISPWVAALVGIGSAFGFFITLGPVIAMRAAVHIIVGLTGAKLFQKGMRPWAILGLTVIPHAIGEALVTLPFGFDLYTAFVIIGVGTVLHHVVDGLIALALKESLAKAGFSIHKLISTDR